MGEGEGAGADREHAGAARAAAREGRRRLLGRRVEHGGVARDDDRVGARAARSRPAAGATPKPLVVRDLGPVQRAGRELVQRRPVRGRGGQPEGLRRRRQVEGDDDRRGRARPSMPRVHGRNLANIGIPASGATVGSRQDPCHEDLDPHLRRHHRPRRDRPLRGAALGPRLGGRVRRPPTPARCGPTAATSASAPTDALADVTEADIVLVPGGRRQPAAAGGRGGALLAARGRSQTKWTTSVCTGSLVLGAAGLLEGKRATGHWLYLEPLRAYGADPVGGRFVEDGKMITAAGVSAGIDMALHLVGRRSAPRSPRRSSWGSSTTRSRPSTPARPSKAPAADRRAGHRRLARPKARR